MLRFSLERRSRMFDLSVCQTVLIKMLNPKYAMTLHKNIFLHCWFQLRFPSAVFLTGSDRIPIHGMESLRIVIQSTTAEERYLPVAHTCYNLLDMPRYQTKEILRRRLTQAVEQHEGFSLVWGAGDLQQFECTLTAIHPHVSVKEWDVANERFSFSVCAQQIVQHLEGLLSQCRVLLF